MTDITSIGEILIDLTQVGVNKQGVALFAANPGGTPANVAVAAARLGASAAFWGKAGRAPSGQAEAAGYPRLCQPGRRLHLLPQRCHPRHARPG